MELRTPETTVVRAAGGIVHRGTGGGHHTEFCIVHRPEYDDWTLPKGKLTAGETEEEAAVREVLEETGMRCRLGRALGTTSYIDRKGRSKIVYYWMMRALSGRFIPNEEIDEVRWLPLGQALRMLTYERDQVLLASLDHRRRPKDDLELRRREIG